MVQLTFATSIALIQLALLAQTSVGLPIESGGMIEPRAPATSDYDYSQLSKRDPPTGSGEVKKPKTDEHGHHKHGHHKHGWEWWRKHKEHKDKHGHEPWHHKVLKALGIKKPEQSETKPSSDTTSASNSPAQSAAGSGNPADLESGDDSGQPNTQTQGVVGSENHLPSDSGQPSSTTDGGNPTSSLSARDWDNLEKRYWDDIELDARGYNDLDDLRLSRREDMELETRGPGSSYGKRSLGDLEERDWDDYWLD